MNNKKIWIYLLSGFVPFLIFVISCILVSYVPFGNIQLNIYDSFTQYPGFIMALKKGLSEGNIFYSWGGALGFNLFSSLCYYGMSPLNLFCIFAKPSNYPVFISLMTFLRIYLLGITMSFYLQKKNIRPIYVILFSTLYALMGFTSAYYYNYMWIHSIIIFPIVIYGLDKLIDEYTPNIYIFSLFLTIYLNFYMGYMIGVFSVVYYIYRLYITKKTQSIKTFIISTFLAVGLSSFILMPTISALIAGKAAGFIKTDFKGLSSTSYTFVLKLLCGTFEANDQISGPALIYSGIITIVLVIFSFFNKKINNREKIATGIVLLILYLSLSVNAFSYAWQMFQKPIWWPLRFSFIFSFFIIVIASNSVKYLSSVKLKPIVRIIVSAIFILLAVIGLIFKNHQFSRNIEIYIFVAFSILIFIEMIFLIDKKFFIPFLIGLSFLEVSINTYNSLHQNITDQKDFYMMSLKRDLETLIPKLEENEKGQFFRMELTNPYTSNDGLYFGYNGINYFNSMRNNTTIEALQKLGINKEDECSLILKKFDPTLLSLLNVKYIYGNMEYFKKEKMLYTNPYPLGIGYVVNEKIKHLRLKDNSVENLSDIVNAMLDKDLQLYKKIDSASFIKTDIKGYIKYTYEFTSNSHYLLMPMDENTTIFINGIHKDNTTYHEIKMDDKVLVNYKTESENLEAYLYMLDIEKYETAMKELEENTMTSYANKNGHIIEGTIENKKDGYMFMTIPYEKGMRVFVDDKEIEFNIILDAFIGFNIKKGNHKIYIDYIPNYLIAGTIVSILSFILALIYLLKRKKNI